MREIGITLLLLIVAIIHLVPLSGVLGVAKLESLYGIPIAGNELAILMRHRAVLFGILGLFFVYAAFKPALQPLAFLAAFTTLASFFYLAWSTGAYNAAISRIVIGDLVAALALLLAVILYYLK